MKTTFGVYRKQRETHMLLVVPTHVASCAAPSFYLQTLTRPHSLAPKTLFWSNMTRRSCTLFQQQTLLITCNMPGQQTTGTVSYCWVKTVQLHSPGSFMQGALPVWNTIWNQNIPRNMPISDRQRQKADSFPAHPAPRQPSMKVVLEPRRWEPDLLLTSPTPTCLQFFDKVTCQAAPELQFPKSPRLPPAW